MRILLPAAPAAAGSRSDAGCVLRADRGYGLAAPIADVRCALCATPTSRGVYTKKILDTTLPSKHTHV